VHNTWSLFFITHIFRGSFNFVYIRFVTKHYMLPYKNKHDLDLFDLVKLDDDIVAFKEIYERYFNQLFIHAYKKLANKEEAQDVVQEIFAIFWKKRTKILIIHSLSAYLFTAVRNKILNIISHKAIESNYIQSIQEFMDTGTCQTDHLIRERDLISEIDKEVSSLPGKMQEIFYLSRYEYFTHKEIATKLNLSEQTVKKQVNNALRILRAKLTTFFVLFL